MLPCSHLVCGWLALLLIPKQVGEVTKLTPQALRDRLLVPDFVPLLPRLFKQFFQTGSGQACAVLLPMRVLGQVVLPEFRLVQAGAVAVAHPKVTLVLAVPWL